MPRTKAEFNFNSMEGSLRMGYSATLRFVQGNNLSIHRSGIVGVYYATDQEVIEALVSNQFPSASNLVSSPKFNTGGWNGQFYQGKGQASNMTQQKITHVMIFFRPNGRTSSWTPIGILQMEDK